MMEFITQIFISIFGVLFQKVIENNEDDNSKKIIVTQLSQHIFPNKA